MYSLTNLILFELNCSNAIYKFDKTEPTDADNSKVKKSVISKI